ncbi:MAG: hypothetical protein BMS9Abin13_527 [Patescibacteria group bacterium]|nr:MAG: hypothetical protein BMS9Abin13_527 [Patescibacteria group bacterium]
MSYQKDTRFYKTKKNYRHAPRNLRNAHQAASNGSSGASPKSLSEAELKDKGQSRRGGMNTTSSQRHVGGNDMRSAESASCVVEANDPQGSLDNRNTNVFLIKKVEKLTTALYLVSSLFPDDEPLKWRLRKIALALLGDASVFYAPNYSSVPEGTFGKLSLAVAEITALLEVAVTAKLISEMNFSILGKEYLALRVLIESHREVENEAGAIVLPHDFFELGEDEYSEESHPPTHLRADTHGQVSGGSGLRHEFLKPGFAQRVAGHTRFTPPASDATEGGQVRGVGEKKSTDGMYNKRQKPHRDTSFADTRRHGNLPVRRAQTGAFDARSSKKVHGSGDGVLAPKDIKSNRRDMILKLFKKSKSKDLTIKDISGSISGCSEKTIQRELLALVAARILGKKGERRWSTYSLRS